MMTVLAKAAVVGGMFLFLRGAHAGVQAAPVEAPKAVEETKPETKEESILDDYVSGVLEDTDAYTGELDKIVGEFAEDALVIVGDMLENNTNPEDMADEMEKRAEKFADDLENSSEIFGEIQEKAGNNFGNKFDKDTAYSVINVVKGFFGRR